MLCACISSGWLTLLCSCRGRLRSSSACCRGRGLSFRLGRCELCAGLAQLSRETGNFLLPVRQQGLGRLDSVGCLARPPLPNGRLLGIALCGSRPLLPLRRVLHGLRCLGSERLHLLLPPREPLDSLVAFRLGLLRACLEPLERGLGLGQAQAQNLGISVPGRRPTRRGRVACRSAAARGCAGGCSGSRSSPGCAAALPGSLSGPLLRGGTCRARGASVRASGATGALRAGCQCPPALVLGLRFALVSRGFSSPGVRACRR
mmetsp:Transcript_585/g.2362  ORF Transcript_585/g.2362 Transcript_585/m.2362 type:complete len:261 (-) Transcript_585:757-1539(-)